MFIAIVFGLALSGVYYDPIQAESGSEAIQLENNGTEPVALADVLLATKQSTYPLPSFTLLPGQGYLIADTNWSSLRDNASWPLADIELPLSLSNTEGFVELIRNGTTLDRLAWNSSFKAREGKMFTPLGEAIPFFRSSASTLTSVDATLIVVDAPPTISNVTITDDAPAPGVQWLSYTRVIRVQATVTDVNTQTVNATVSFLGATYAMALENGVFSVSFPFEKTVPGVYTLDIVATDGLTSVTYREGIAVIASTSITTSGSLVLQGAPGETAHGAFTVTNEGTAAKHIVLQHTLPEARCDAAQFTLEPDESMEVTCTLTIPAYMPGEYNYTVRLIAS